MSEAVEANQYYFFENWFMKLKCPSLLKPLCRHHNSTKLWLLLPLRAIYFSTFQYETPCSCANCKLKAHIRVLLYYTIENFAGAIHAQGRKTVRKSGWGKASKRKRFC